MIFNPKPTKFILEISQVLADIDLQINTEIGKKLFQSAHKNNLCNKRFSIVLDTFNDLKITTFRLESTIIESMRLEHKIQAQRGIDQSLYKQSSYLSDQNKSDFRSLYVKSKVFLDEYTRFLIPLFKFRGIKSGSVTEFFHSLEEYSGIDGFILELKAACLSQLREVDLYITSYRDESVIHIGNKHKHPTEWFMNNMDGSIGFIGGSMSSVTPQDVLFVSSNYLDSSFNFFRAWTSRLT